MHLVSSKDISKAIHLEKFGGEVFAKLLMQLLSLNKLNRLYSETKDKSGIDFINSVIEHLEFNYEVIEEDLKKILTEPKNSLIKQYTALLETEDIKISFLFFDNG